MRSLIFLLAMSIFTNASAATLFVDQNARGTNDGTSWANARVDLQDALRSAGNGDQIWIARGTYTPTSSSDRTVEFRIPTGVRLYGGFSGGESALEERDPASNRTVLSGDIGEPRPDGSDWDPEAIWARDNSVRLVLLNSVSATTTLDGLELSESGRALDILGGAPRIVNCVVRWNHGNGQGIGALLRFRAMPEFSDVIFERNSSAQRAGGGVAADAGTAPRFIRVVFRNNSAAIQGGGMSGTGDFEDVQFIGNVARRGGGLAGGGRLCNVTFEANNGGAHGGGLWSAGGITAQNISFIGNKADQGAAFHLGAVPDQFVARMPTSVFVNLTVANNTAGSGAVIQCAASDLSVVSSVLAEPNAPAPQAWFGTTDATVAVSHSLVQGSGGSGPDWNPAIGPDLGGNLDADPGYVSPDDFRLGAGAPAIDAGDSAALLPGTDTDLDGNPRIAGAGVDMGAWEYQGTDEPPVVADDLFAARITPRSLNLRSRGKFVQLSLTALGSVPVDEIDPESLRLQDLLEPERWELDDETLQVKFDRADFAMLLEAGPSAEITVTGSLFDGTGFEAIDKIRLIGSEVAGDTSEPPRAYPNPFNPATTIRFELERDMRVELAIYDVSGRLVRTLVSGPLAAGQHGQLWNGTDETGRSVASGVYFARLATEVSERVGRLVLVK